MAARTGLPGNGLFVGLLVATMTCSPAGAGEQPSGQPSVSASALPTAGSEGTPIPVADIAHAWPRVAPRTINVAGGLSLAEVGITPDGELALGELVDANGQQIGMATVNRETGVATLVRRFSDPQTQLISIAADKDWIVWVEASNQSNFGNWVIYSINRHSQVTRTLAKATRPDGVHYPDTPYVTVSISGGIVVWSAIVGTDRRERAYQIGADGTGLATLAEDAQAPQIIWPWVMFDTMPRTSEAADHLTLENLETHQVVAVTGPSGVGYFAFTGNSVAWITQDFHDLSILDIGDGAIVPIVKNSINLQFVQASTRLIGWGQVDGTYVYDRKLGVIVKLGDILNSNPIISEQALDWSQYLSPGSRSSAVWKQLNVRDLP